ncbi:MAG: pyridoxamine 5'-phosphate oxidase family protein [Bacteroidota bacterium]
MILSHKIKKSIDSSVLCWLATVSKKGMPNVSPKEIFKYYGEDQVIIANIASPQSVRNIKQNEQVCLSFIDILVQKGFQLKGEAVIVTNQDEDFPKMEAVLLEMTEGKFPFKTITAIRINRVKPIIAPRYLLYPETTEAAQIASAKKAYKLG